MKNNDHRYPQEVQYNPAEIVQEQLNNHKIERFERERKIKRIINNSKRFANVLGTLVLDTGLKPSELMGKAMEIGEFEIRIQELKKQQAEIIKELIPNEK